MQPSKQFRRIPTHALPVIRHVYIKLRKFHFWFWSLSILPISFANRLTHIKENHKFQQNGREGHREDDPAKGLAHIVNEIKGKHELKYDIIRYSFCLIMSIGISKVIFLIYCSKNSGMYMYGMQLLDTGVESGQVLMEWRTMNRRCSFLYHHPEFRKMSLAMLWTA